MAPILDVLLTALLSSICPFLVVFGVFVRLGPGFRPICGRFHAKCISVRRSSGCRWGVLLKSAVLPQGDVGYAWWAGNEGFSHS